MPWATHIDLTQSLTLEDYYRTDTHWRQECLLDTAALVCQAMGVTPPQESDYVPTTLSRPFYGVYYGQAALPMEPDSIQLLTSELLDNCTVYDYETGKTSAVYNLDKLDSPDLYDVFLCSGIPLEAAWCPCWCRTMPRSPWWTSGMCGLICWISSWTFMDRTF